MARSLYLENTLKGVFLSNEKTIKIEIICLRSNTISIYLLYLLSLLMVFKKQKQYRLFGYNYASNGMYFITIVCKNREYFFGKIIDNQILLSPIGEYTEQNIKNVAKSIEYIKILNWVIMPNHIHLLIMINQSNELSQKINTGISPLNSKSISSFINHFKGNIKKWCNINNFNDFEWQARFHDRIIRDNDEYTAISIYIDNNINNWEKDSENIPIKK